MIRVFATLALCCTAGIVLAAEPDVSQHTIEVRLLPASGELELTDNVQLAGRDQFSFRLAPWLNLTRATVDSAAVSTERSGQHYRVSLPDKGGHVLSVEIAGTVPSREPADAFSSSDSDGAFLPGFAAWIPLDERGRMRYQLTVDVPAGYRAVATGRLTEERTSADGYRATFVAERASEPPSLFAGPYTIRETFAQDIRLRTYLHEELVDLGDAYLQAAGRFIERYAAAIGDYPYADFHIVSAPLPVGLGFPNLTYVGRRVLPLPFMRTRSLAHEVLHNWWGNGVTVDYAGGNWSEGLTTYMADYALAAEQGDEQGRAMRTKWLRDYAALPPERDTAVLDFTAKRHQAAQVVGYSKAAFIFHMLAVEIGHDAFAAGVRRFWSLHAFESAGWQQLRAAFEHTSGRRLDWFFAQWLNRTGAPALTLGPSEVRRTDSAFEVRIEVRQSSPYYRLKLPVVLETRTGIEKRFAAVDGVGTVLEFVTDSQPLSVHVDAFSDVFRRLTPEETPPIMRDVTLHPAAITLIATEEDAYRESARALAARLMDTEPRFGTLAQAQEAGAPVLLIADVHDATELLASLQVRDIPALPEAAHSAAAWSARRDNGLPVLVVTASTAAALRALLRPLPHYGGRSYVLFDGAKAMRKGVWPVTRSPLRRDLGPSP